VPPGRHQPEPVLSLVQGVSGGRQEAAGRRYRDEATSDEVKGLRTDAQQLKELLAEVLLENRLLKKSVIGDGESDT
jgi:transposase